MMRGRCFSLGFCCVGLLVSGTAAAEEALIVLPSVHHIAPDESVTLPTNPVLLGLVGPGEVTESDITVTFTSDGETRAVPFEVTTATDSGGVRELLVRATPADVQPGSSFVISFEMPAGGLNAAYTVGEADDDTAPTFGADAEMPLTRTDSDGELWRPQFHLLEGTAPLAVDDLGLSLYVLERRLDDGEFMAAQFAPAMHVEAPFIWEDAVRKGEASSPTEQICYRWRALDLAGNEAALEESCVPVPAGGCACAQSSTSGAALPFAALAGLLFALRRRRQGKLSSQARLMA